jgi:hypothetical protein
MILAKISTFPNLIPDQQAVDPMLNTQYPPAIFCTDLLHTKCWSGITFGHTFQPDAPSLGVVIPPPPFHT